MCSPLAGCGVHITTHASVINMSSSSSSSSALEASAYAGVHSSAILYEMTVGLYMHVGRYLGLFLGIIRGCRRTVRAQCGTFLMFLEILSGEEADCKSLWWVFPNACGWSPEALG